MYITLLLPMNKEETKNAYIMANTSTSIYPSQSHSVGQMLTFFSLRPSSTCVLFTILSSVSTTEPDIQNAH